MVNLNRNEMIHAVVGILKRNNKILIAERPTGKTYSGYWEFPGGKIEKNEQPLEALKRELYEELDIEVISARHLLKHSHDYPDKTVMLEIWLVEIFNGEPVSKENQTLYWATVDELEKFPFLKGNLAILSQIMLFNLT